MESFLSPEIVSKKTASSMLFCQRFMMNLKNAEEMQTKTVEIERTRCWAAVTEEYDVHCHA